MDKLNIIKEKLVKEYSGLDETEYSNSLYDNSKPHFIAGFDAAMELQLPVKFRDWEQSIEGQAYVGLCSHNNSQQIYDYWLKNIYQPE